MNFWPAYILWPQINSPQNGRRPKSALIVVRKSAWPKSRLDFLRQPKNEKGPTISGGEMVSP
jgi:hypothetical protein